MTPVAYCNEVGPVRVLTAWLPLPTVTKHHRVGTTRQGRRFLVPEARAYRALVVATIRPLLPKRPWFDSERHWHVSFVQYMDGNKSDQDQWLGGLVDDLVETGLVADDSKARLSRLVTRDDGPGGIFLVAAQEAA